MRKGCEKKLEVGVRKINEREQNRACCMHARTNEQNSTLRACTAGKLKPRVHTNEQTLNSTLRACSALCLLESPESSHGVSARQPAPWQQVENASNTSPWQQVENASNTSRPSRVHRRRPSRALRARPSSSAACTSVLPLPAGELRLECSTPPVGMNLNASPRPASTRSSPGQGCQLLDWSTNKSTWPPPKCAGAGSSRQKPQGR